MASIFDNAQIGTINGRPSILGMGSGMDTTTILQAELDVQKLKLKPLEEQLSSVKSTKSTWESLKTSLTNFNNLVEKVTNLSTTNKSVTLSEEGYISATASGEAIDGSYSITVEQLATKHRVMGDTLAEGELGISETVKLNGKELTITADMDLKGIAKEINKGDFGVDAVVLQGQLVLTAKNSGEENAITFEGQAWETLGLTDKGIIKNELQAAQDAKFTINGISMTNSSNSFTDLEGLTINFNKVTDAPIELGVSHSADDVATLMKELVDGYNAVINNINNLTGHNSMEGAETAALLGDSLLRNLKKEMSGLLTNTISGSAMSELGIKFSSANNGQLEFDEEKFKAAYDSDASKVLNMLNGEKGFATRLTSIVDKYINENNGLVNNKIESLEARLERTQDTIDRYNLQFDKKKESLLQKYARFEVMMSALQQQQTYIEMQVDAWNNQD